jgi:hypothetical protein
VAALHEAEQPERTTSVPAGGSWVVSRARLGYAATWRRWAQESKATINAEPSFMHGTANLAFARVLQAQGAQAEALTWLERLLHGAEATDSGGARLRFCFQALTLQAIGRAAIAGHTATRALARSTGRLYAVVPGRRSADEIVDF